MIISKSIRRTCILGFEIVVCIIIGLIASNAMAAQATLAWDPNTESNLAGYRVHYGTVSRSYAFSLDVRKVTICSVAGLTEGQTYYFAVSAYDTSGNESGFSNEVLYTPAPGSQPPPGADQTSNYSIGVFRPSIGAWYLDVDMSGRWSGCGTDGCYTFGTSGDLPVTGDWNNDGFTEIGVFRPSTGDWFLDLSSNDRWDSRSVDGCYTFGIRGDLPVTGDWNNDGFTEIGVFRPSAGIWFLDRNGNMRWDGCAVDRCYQFGINGDVPVSGDWSHDGVTKIGVYRPSSGMWFLDFNGNGNWDGCTVDRCYQFGGAQGDVPVSGDWNHDGVTKIGVYRPSIGMWFLDLNGDGNWDGCAVDGCYQFGISSDLPVTGQW